MDSFSGYHVRVLVVNFLFLVQKFFWCRCKLLFTNSLHKIELPFNFFYMLDSGLSGLRFCLGHLNFGDSNLFRISHFEFRISGLSGLGFVNMVPGAHPFSQSRFVIFGKSPV